MPKCDQNCDAVLETKNAPSSETMSVMSEAESAHYIENKQAHNIHWQSKNHNCRRLLLVDCCISG